jgi:hypothetical protein
MKIHSDFHNLELIAGVVDTGNKLFTGVNDTGDILSPVSLLPVSLMPVIKPCSGFATGNNNTGTN